MAKEKEKVPERASKPRKCYLQLATSTSHAEMEAAGAESNVIGNKAPELDNVASR